MWVYVHRVTDIMESVLLYSIILLRKHSEQTVAFQSHKIHTNYSLLFWDKLNILLRSGGIPPASIHKEI